MRDRNEDRAELGDLTATPMRERGERDGRRYWRIRDRERRTVATGWWTRDELDGAIAVALTSPRKTSRARSGAGSTVSDLLGLWRTAQLQRHAAGEIAPRTLDVYRHSVRSWLATDLASMLVSKLTRAHVADQVTAWRAAHVAARTVDLQVRILRIAVSWGADRGHCPDLDLALAPSARDDEHVYSGRVPTRAELVAVLAAMAPGPRRDAVEILGLTGARLGEVGALRVGDVDLAARTLRIWGRDEERNRRGKTRARLFPLRGRLLELCAELITTRPDGATTGEVSDGHDEAREPVGPVGPARQSPPAGPGDVLPVRRRDVRGDQHLDAVGRAVPVVAVAGPDVGGHRPRPVDVPVSERDTVGRDADARRPMDEGGAPEDVGTPSGVGSRVRPGRPQPAGLTRPATDRLLALPWSSNRAVGGALERTCKALGVEPVTPHGIRRLVVSELLEAAHGNAKRVSQLTGHSVMILMRHYVRPTANELGSLVEVAQLGEVEVDNVTPMRRKDGA